MANRDTLAAVQYFEGKTTIVFTDRDPLMKEIRPSIPNIDYDDLLRYDIPNSVAEYLKGGVMQTMTAEQKEAVLQWVDEIDFPAYAYDPSHFNVYMGFMSESEIVGKNYIAVHVAPQHDIVRYDTVTKQWATIYAVICPSGILYTNPKNSKGSLADDPTKACGTDIQTAALLLSYEEYSELIAKRYNDSDLYNFETGEWIDSRSQSEYLRDDVDLALANVFNDVVHHAVYGLNIFFPHISNPRTEEVYPPVFNGNNMSLDLCPESLQDVMGSFMTLAEKDLMLADSSQTVASIPAAMELHALFVKRFAVLQTVVDNTFKVIEATAGNGTTAKLLDLIHAIEEHGKFWLNQNYEADLAAYNAYYKIV